MTTHELLELHKTTYDKTHSILISKNKDYSGGNNDPFANFVGTEYLCVPAEIGICIRIMDKIKRIQAFSNNGTLAVKDEPVEDACLDIMNYAFLILAYIQHKKEQKNDI